MRRKDVFFVEEKKYGEGKKRRIFGEEKYVFFCGGEENGKGGGKYVFFAVKEKEGNIWTLEKENIFFC